MAQVLATHRAYCGQLGMKRHNLQPTFRESSDSLRPQAASTNLPMPSTPASGNGVYAWALGAILSPTHCHTLFGWTIWTCRFDNRSM